MNDSVPALSRDIPWTPPLFSQNIGFWSPLVCLGARHRWFLWLLLCHITSMAATPATICHAGEHLPLAPLISLIWCTFLFLKCSWWTESPLERPPRANNSRWAARQGSFCAAHLSALRAQTWETQQTWPYGHGSWNIKQGMLCLQDKGGNHLSIFKVLLQMTFTWLTSGLSCFIWTVAVIKNLLPKSFWPIGLLNWSAKHFGSE